MDPWDTRQAWRQFLELLPYLAAFLAGGLYSVLLARIVEKKARKRWDADYMSRQTAEARKEIEARDARIAELRAQLEDAYSTVQEQAAVRKAATMMCAQASQMLVSVPRTRTSRHG